jgi:hypothetical protein
MPCPTCDDRSSGGYMRARSRLTASAVPYAEPISSTLRATSPFFIASYASFTCSSG